MGNLMTVSKAGITAQKLRHLDLLLEAPWSVRIGPETKVPVERPADLLVPNPLSFIVQKLLIHKRREAEKKAQDILYIHDNHERLHQSLDYRTPASVPFEVLATLGCAVVTGIGAVTNAARVEKGARVVVIGAGGVGLNVVQGAVLVGCEKIIAVDTRPRPLNLARDFGATHTIEAGAGNVAEEVRALTDGRGADSGFRHGRHTRDYFAGA